MIRASKLLRKKVVDNEGNKIGLLVNVIFNIDPDLLNARMLVFPYKPCRWVKVIKNIAKEGTSVVIDDKLTSGSHKLGSKLAKTGHKVVFDELDDIQKEKEEKSLVTYYLIPFSKVVDIDQKSIDEIELTIDCEDCQNAPRKLRKGDYPFFEDRDFDEIETMLPTTLERQPIEYLKGRLQNGKKGLIVDIELDCKKDCVENLIIEAYGNGAGEYRVDAKEFNFTELNLKQAPKLTASGGT